MAVAVLALCIVAAGCSSATPDIGIVKGVATPCVGMVEPGHPRPSVTVRAYLTSVPLTTEVAGTTTAGNDGLYELHLRPGTYTLQAPVSRVGPIRVTIAAGQTVVANFDRGCK
jgi:hypothetical protein